MNAAGVSAGFNYFALLDMEKEGEVISKWEEGPLAIRGKYRRRLYRLRP